MGDGVLKGVLKGVLGLWGVDKRRIRWMCDGRGFLGFG